MEESFRLKVNYNFNSKMSRIGVGVGDRVTEK